MNDIPSDLLVGWDIVIIDDEPDSLTVAGIILDFYGANVRTADNGQKGLELVQSGRPRFIISDLSMPEMDGWEFLSRLRADPTTQDIPVIALTAHALAGDRDRVLMAGFESYLTKPLNANTFMQQLVEIFGSIPALREHLKASNQEEPNHEQV
jgi:CheY-like chemotaxis protein